MVERILTINVEEDKANGKKLLKFIEHTDITYGNQGYWTERYLSNDQFKTLMKICYPKWDGEHQIDTCCTDDYDGDPEMNSQIMKILGCPGCPHTGCPKNPVNDPNTLE